MNEYGEMWQGWEPAEPDDMPDLPPARFQRLAEGEPVLVVLRATQAIDDETLWRFAARLVVQFRLGEQNTPLSAADDAATAVASVQEANVPPLRRLQRAIVVELRPTIDYPAGQPLDFWIDPEIAVGGYPHAYVVLVTRAVMAIGVVAVNNNNGATKAVNANLQWTENNSARTLFGNLFFQHPPATQPALANATWFAFNVAPAASWAQYQITGSITIT